MVSSWSTYVSHCKSRLSAIARSCFLGRALWREKFKEVNELIEDLRKEIEAAEAYGQKLEQENTQLRERVSELEAQLAQPQSVKLPLGDVPRGQQYGAGYHPHVVQSWLHDQRRTR